MSNRDDLSHDEFLSHRVEEAGRKLELWSQKGLVLMENLPDEGVCPICFLSGDTDLRPHAIIILCPHPSGFIQTYRWSGDRLVKDQKLVADHTAVEATVKGLVDRYIGKPQPSANCFTCGGPLERRHLVNGWKYEGGPVAHDQCWEGYWCSACCKFWSDVEATSDSLCGDHPES